jgi:hypothetical protein
MANGAAYIQAGDSRLQFFDLLHFTFPVGLHPGPDGRHYFTGDIIRGLVQLWNMTFGAHPEMFHSNVFIRFYTGIGEIFQTFLDGGDDRRRRTGGSKQRVGMQ